jgi:tetratricopeptide (TPR) repeat protein
MANVEEQLGNFQKALDLNEKALEIFVKVPGRHHVRVAMTKGNLGYVYEGFGDLAQALSCIEEAYSIFLRSLGADHPNTKKAARGLERLKKGADASVS